MGRIRTYEIKEFDATSLTGSYQNFGTTTSDEVVTFSFYNTSDVDVYISHDGSTNHWRVPSNGALTVDSYALNKEKFLISKGKQLSVKQVTGAGASGNIIANLVLEG